MRQIKIVSGATSPQADADALEKRINHFLADGWMMTSWTTDGTKFAPYATCMLAKEIPDAGSEEGKE